MNLNSTFAADLNAVRKGIYASASEKSSDVQQLIVKYAPYKDLEDIAKILSIPSVDVNTVNTRQAILETNSYLVAKTFLTDSRFNPRSFFNTTTQLEFKRQNLYAWVAVLDSTPPGFEFEIRDFLVRSIKSLASWEQWEILALLGARAGPCFSEFLIDELDPDNFSSDESVQTFAARSLIVLSSVRSLGIAEKLTVKQRQSIVSNFLLHPSSMLPLQHLLAVMDLGSDDLRALLGEYTQGHLNVESAKVLIRSRK